MPATTGEKLLHNTYRTYKQHDNAVAAVPTKTSQQQQLRLVAELFLEHWITLKRHARNLSLQSAEGGADAEAFCAAACHSIALAARDEPAVGTLVYRAVPNFDKGGKGGASKSVVVKPPPRPATASSSSAADRSAAILAMPAATTSTAASAKIKGARQAVFKNTTSGAGVPYRCVDMELLHKECNALLKQDSKWRDRFQADGVMSSSVQRATVGVVTNANDYRRKYDGPPFAVTGDPECVNKLQRAYLLRRCKLFERQLTQFALDPKDPQWVKVPDFFKALNSIERYGCSEVDASHIIKVLDPKQTGLIHIGSFMDRYAFDLMKSKSNRNALGHDNNDGKRTVFEWPEGRSLVEEGKIKGKNMTAIMLQETVSTGKHNKKRLSAIPRTRAFKMRTEAGRLTRQFMDEIDGLQEASLVTVSAQQKQLQEKLKIDLATAGTIAPTPPGGFHHEKGWNARGNNTAEVLKSQDKVREELLPLSARIHKTEHFRATHHYGAEPISAASNKSIAVPAPPPPPTAGGAKGTALGLGNVPRRRPVSARVR